MNPSRALLAAVLLFPAALQASETDSLDAQFSALKQRAKASVAASQATAAQAPPQPAPVIVSGIDMSEFLRRLEDMTLDTTVLRGLLGQIGASFRPPTGTANAQYGQVLNHLYLPDTLKAPGRNALRYDLRSNEIATVIHELTHASADHLASSDAADGSAGAEHYKALRIISAQVRDGRLLARYPNTKADELAGYYLGCAVADLADTITFLKAYNLGMAKPADREEAERLGGRMLNFDEKTGGQTQPAPTSWSQTLRRQLGDCSVGGEAQFEGNPIGVEPDFGAKGLLFQGALGLKPPLSARDLVKRLNDPARASAGLAALRRELYEARLQNAAAAKK